MKIAVTGGGGFLGKRICSMLKERGHEVRSITRTHSQKLVDLGIEQFHCDIANEEELTIALAGVEAVIHTAAKAGVWGRPKDFFDINAKGTINIVDTCKKLRINKLVYTSTPSVVFGESDLSGVDETQPYPKVHLCEYARTKTLAEKYVLEGKSRTLHVCCLRPHLIWGPGDPHILPRLIEKAKNGKLKAIGERDNLVDIVYVDNAAYAHVLAVEKLDETISGNVYFIGQNEPVNLWSFIDSMLATQKLTPVKSKVSFKFAYNIGEVFEKFYNTFKIYKSDPPMTRFVALQMAKSHFFKHDKIVKDLGYTELVSTEEGLNRLASQNS